MWAKRELDCSRSIHKYFLRCWQGFHERFCFRAKRNRIAEANRRIDAGPGAFEIVNSRVSMALTRNLLDRFNLHNPFVGNSANTYPRASTELDVFSSLNRIKLDKRNFYSLKIQHQNHRDGTTALSERQQQMTSSRSSKTLTTGPAKDGESAGRYMMEGIPISCRRNRGHSNCSFRMANCTCRPFSGFKDGMSKGISVRYAPYLLNSTIG